MEYKNRRPVEKVNIDKVIGRYPKEEIIEIVMDQYGEQLIRFIYTYVKDWGKAEDIIQEVMVTCFKKLDTFRGESSFKTWIYRIAINRSKDYLRSWSFRNISVTDLLHRFVNKDLTNSPESELLKKNNREEIAKLVLSLPVKYREVLLLFYYEELSIFEICELLMEKESTIKTRLHRARLLLKERITSEKGSDM